MQKKDNPARSSSFGFILENDLKAYRRFLLDSGLPQVSFPRGTVITGSGTASSGVFFLLDGVVKVSVTNIHGYERILGYHKKNSLFAMDGLKHSEKVVVTTTAVTPVSAPPEAARIPSGFPVPSPVKKASSSLVPILLANSLAM